MNDSASCVLVIDDDPANRLVITKSLEKSGYKVLGVPGGDEAIALADQCRPDLIILEVVVSDTAGFEICSRLKSHPVLSDVPIVFITDPASSQVRAKALEAGADDFLSRPVDQVELLTRASSLIRLRRLQDRLAIRDQTLAAFAEGKEKEWLKTSGSFRILLVEDDPDFVKLFKVLASNEPWEINHVTDGKAALAAIDQEKFDLVVLDIMLPGSDGYAVIHAVRGDPSLQSLPILVVTALEGVRDRIAALEAGADDFLSKPIAPAEVRARLRALLRKKAIMDTLAENYQRALGLSAIDSLTGLFNHGYFHEYLNRELERSRRYHHQLSLIMLDVDFFKIYNDTHGHPVGDRALKKISRLIELSIRATDLAARYGGEEFVVVLPETSVAGVIPLAERIRKSIEDTAFPGEEILPTGKLTVSLGVAVFPDHASTAEEIVAAADKALYRAKKKGKNRVIQFKSTA